MGIGSGLTAKMGSLSLTASMGIEGYSNAVTNGTFDTDTDWTKGTGWTISGGKARAVATTGNLTQAGVTTGAIGVSYEVTYTISDYGAGTVRLKVGAGSGTLRSGDGTYTEIIETTSTNSNLWFDGVGAFTGNIDNVIAIKQ